jgi:hypothetical protein
MMVMFLLYVIKKNTKNFKIFISQSQRIGRDKEEKEKWEKDGARGEVVVKYISRNVLRDKCRMAIK